jgi:hypothetical protein
MSQPLNWRLLTLGLSIIFMLIASPLHAQSPTRTLSLAGYRDELATAIAQLEAVPEENATLIIEQVQERFAEMGTVELPSGEQVEIISILADLPTSTDEGLDTGDPAQLATPREVALARLRGAMAQIDASARDDTAARLAVLDEVLARPEFSTPLSLWDRFWQWVENLLNRLFPDSRRGPAASWVSVIARLVAWLVAIVVLAAIIWLLSYWLQRLLRSLVADARVDILPGDEDLPRSAAEARQQARVAAQSGLYRDAVRRLYLAALLQLSEYQLITYERSLTNREVLVRVPKNSPIRTHLEPVVATFDQVWYGVREPDQATFAAYEREIDTLSTVAKEAAANSPREGAV